MPENKKENIQQESPVLKWVKNAILGATMADLPAMMTASGWRLNKKGEYVLDLLNNPHVKLLRNNLANEAVGVITGEFGMPALFGLYNLGLRGLGIAGNTWARAKLISKEMKNIKTPISLNAAQIELVYKPTVQLPSKTNLLLLLRPSSKISESERLGIPKYERKQSVKPSKYTRNNAHTSLYIGGAKDNRNLPFTNEDIMKADDYISYNMQLSNTKARRNFEERYNQVLDRSLGNTLKLEDFNLLLKDYIKNLPDADEMFLNSNNFLSAYVLDFRKYLYNLGFDAKDISDNDIARLLTLLYKDLNANMQGKTKGMIMWHGSNKMFDTFDLSKTGTSTGNMGYGGPGNYFSNARSLYGNSENKGVLNMLPYLINNILSTPSISIMQEKGLLPQYVSPGSKSYMETLLDLILKTPTNDNKLYIDDISAFPKSTLTPPNGYKDEYMLRRNTGIKSLYPHPSRFIRDANGTVSVSRDWNDPRVNYKNGGIIGLRNIYGID